MLALGVVVLGHLSIAVIDREGGTVRGANLFELRPGWAWVAAGSPMPVFFAAAGWANATATPRAAATRLRTLAGLGLVVVGVWSAGVVLAALVAGDAGVVADGARIATQPLWFLAAYAPFAVAGGWIGRGPARRPLPWVAGGFALLVAGDVARLRFDAPEWSAWPGFFAAWGMSWLAGAWWRYETERGDFPERAAGVLLAVAAGTGAWAVVRWAGYAAALIDVVPGARSNTTPPTTYTALAGLAQTGVLLVGAGALDRVGHRFSRGVAAAGSLAVGVYVWHLSALALLAGVVAVGLPVPSRLTSWWWAARPVWFGAVLGITAVLVAATSRVRGRRSLAEASPARPVAGALLLAAGAAGVGLVGPRRPAAAAVWTGVLLASWLLLRPTALRRVASAVMPDSADG